MRYLAPLLALLVTTPLLAQSPRISPDGDPSIDDDSIYALTVDPAEHPEEDVVLLLDDGVVRREADGTGARTYRMVAQILTRDAVDAWSEHTFSYNADRENLRLNWARVISADGSVISAEPIHRQTLSAPVAEQSPVYTDWKRLRISLGGVEPGTIVDYSYTIETLDPQLSGDFLSSWLITTGGTVRRSRFILDIPLHLQPRIEERNLSFEPHIRETNDRRVYEWATAELERIEPERFAADSNGIIQRLAISGQITWDDIASWYADLVRDRDELTPEIEAKLEEVVAGAATLDDSLRAAHRWIAQDFRYVSLSLGQGDYRPRRPADVFSTRSGDCKDKTMLFIAVARRMGVESHPVLLSSYGGVDENLPSLEQFDHMVAAVRSGDGWLYVDLTAGLVPFGRIPPSFQGGFGLVVHDDGTGERITFPEAGIAGSRHITRIDGRLDPKGTFIGRYTQRATGAAEFGLRGSLARKFTRRERDQIARALANGIFEGATADSIELFDGRDLGAQPRVSLWLRKTRATTRTPDGSYILDVPIANQASPELISELETDDERRFPIDVSAIGGRGEMVADFRVTLPSGWTARLPDDIHAVSAFGRYRVEYAQEGRELRIVRSYTGRDGVEPPETIGELIGWLREIARDDVRYIVIEPGSGSDDGGDPSDSGSDSDDESGFGA